MTTGQEPRLAILTIRGDSGWYSCVVWAIIQDGLIAGNEYGTGEWFQVPAHNCNLSYDPREVGAWPST